jgi:hypothetical protein
MRRKYVGVKQSRIARAGLTARGVTIGDIDVRDGST